MTLISVPALSSKVDPEVKRAVVAIINNFNDILSGKTSVASAFASDTSQYSVLSGGIAGGFPAPDIGDYVDPIAPENLSVNGAFNSLILTWEYNGDIDYVARFEIFRAITDNLGTAVNVGSTNALVYADVPSDSDAEIEYFYWVRAVSTSDPPFYGAFNDISGTSGSTATEPSYMLQVLTDSILNSKYVNNFDDNGFLNGAGKLLSSPSGVPFSELYLMADRVAVIDPPTAPKTITSLTRSGTTATAACAAHGFLTGERHVITGAAQGEYNGQKLITVTDADHFTFTVMETAATPATIADGFTAIKVSETDAKVPFVVQGGKVYMDVALIKDATIEAAKIASLNADVINAGTLNAARIGAGSITASHVGTNEIIANTANIQNALITGAKIALATIAGANIGLATIGGANIQDATITGAKIGDAEVDTLQLAGDAVTVPGVSYSSSSMTVDSGDNQILSLTVVNDYDIPLYLIFAAKFSTPVNEDTVSGFDIDIKRNGTSIRVLYSQSGYATKSNFCFPILDAPGIGTFVYTFWASRDGAATSYVSIRSIIVIGCKR